MNKLLMCLARWFDTPLEYIVNYSYIHQQQLENLNKEHLKIIKPEQMCQVFM
jgi:hypothetical protein